MYSSFQSFFNKLFVNVAQLNLVRPKAVASRTIEGEISYAGAKYLTNDHIVYVTLEDVSRKDVPAIKLGEQVISLATEFPIKFNVSFDATTILNRIGGSYNLRVRIEKNKTLHFITDTHYGLVQNGVLLNNMNVSVINVNEPDDLTHLIEGYINFGTHQALNPGAVAVITVEDHSRIDAAPVVLGKQLVHNLTTFPIKYQIEFNAEPVYGFKYGKYSLEVRILLTNNKLEYLNDQEFSIMNDDFEIVSSLNVSVVQTGAQVNALAAITGQVQCDTPNATIESNSVLEIVVREQSRMDAPAVQLGNAIINLPVNAVFPLDYSVDFNPQSMLAEQFFGVYAISASVYTNNTLKFITNERISIVGDDYNSIRSRIPIKVIVV